MGLKDLEDLAAVIAVRLVARGAQGGAGGLGDQFQIVACLLRQIQEVFVDDASDAVQCAIDMLHISNFTGFDDGADHRLIDDGGRTASLCNQDLTVQHLRVTPRPSFRPRRCN